MSDQMNTPPVGPSPTPRPRPTPEAAPPAHGHVPAHAQSPVHAEQQAHAQPPVHVEQPAHAQSPTHAQPSAQQGGPIDTSEYSATLIAPAQIAISVALAVILAIVVLAVRTSLWPFAIIVLVGVGGTGFYLAGISLLATRTYLEIGQGRREREPRRVSNDEIVAVSSADLTWRQVFGLDLPRGESTTRLTVRPGATLIVELRTGEVIRVSTPEPARAIAALGRAG